jgi:hypothetical protein
LFMTDFNYCARKTKVLSVYVWKIGESIIIIIFGSTGV